MIHSILPVQFTCFTVFFHNLSPGPLWSTSWSGTFHLILYTFLHPIIIFLQQKPTPSQLVLLYYRDNVIYSILFTHARTHTHTHTHTQTIVLWLFWILSRTTRVCWYQKGKNQEGKTNLDLLEQEIVSGSGICWAIRKSATQTDNHANIHQSVFLQAGCPSCRPTNSVKALKAAILFYSYTTNNKIITTPLHQKLSTQPQMNAGDLQHWTYHNSNDNIISNTITFISSKNL